MSMRKYAIAEQTQVLSPKEHEQIEADLHKIGKRSASTLTDEERAKVLPQKT